MPSFVFDRMTVAALLVLKNESSLQFQRSTVFQELRLQFEAFPSFHMRRPRTGHPGVSEHPNGEESNDHGQYRNWPASPALLAFVGYKRERKKHNHRQCRKHEKEQHFRASRPESGCGERKTERMIPLGVADSEERIRVRPR